MKWKNFFQRKNFTGVRLHVIPSGHLIVKAFINGRKGRFVLDTGASHTCIDLSRAAYYRLQPIESDETATGAGTRDIEMMQAFEVRFKLGKWRHDNLHMALLDLSHINSAFASMHLPPVDGVIGSDILMLSEAVIHYGKKKLWLKKRIFRY